MKYARSSHGASACDLMVSNNISHLYVCIMLVENDLLTLLWAVQLLTQLIIETRFHNLQRQALTQFIKLYQYMT